MANREQRGNRETRKPKKEKAVKPAAPSGSAPPKNPPQAWKQKPPKG